MCPKDRKVRPREWDFLMDQRRDREQFISKVDKGVTDAWDKLSKRKTADNVRQDQEEIRCEEVLSTRKAEMVEFWNFELNDNNIQNDEKSDADFQGTDADGKKQDQNRLDLNHFIAEVDRYQISDRAAAALATGLLRDVGLVTGVDLSNVVDKYKIRRARKKRQKEKKRKRFLETNSNITCLGFDGKRDKNTRVLTEEDINGNRIIKQGTVTEEHIVFVDQPSGQYLDHIVVEAGHGTGKDLAIAIADMIREYDSVESIVCICSDGTAVNTGYLSGAIAELERILKKSLQWFVCLITTAW